MAAVAVAGLIEADAKVEIEATEVVPEEHRTATDDGLPLGLVLIGVTSRWPS